MELGYYREFITFSRYLNISKAAKKLHLSQSTLSHHIAALEKELGVVLVNREMPISLTSAGRALVRMSDDWLRTYDKMVESVHEAANESLELCVSLNDTRTGAHHSLYALLFRFGKLHPEIYVRYVPAVDSTAAAALRDPRVDCVGVIMCPIPSDLEEGVQYHRVPALYPNRLLVWMDKTHPLASKEELHWQDLKGVHIPLPSNFNRLWASTMPQLLRNHGVEPLATLHALDPQSFLNMVAADEVQIYDECWRDYVPIAVDDNRILKPIDEPDAIDESFIAFRSDAMNPALKMFIDFIETVEDTV